MRKRVSLKMVGALVVVVALAAACDPGWVNPVAGTGDGSGTPAGSVAVPDDHVALGSPMAMVDLGARGYLVYDDDDCTILLVADGSATRYAGNGTCGSTGDGGPATDAALRVCLTPLGSSLLADPDGNVYFTAEHAGTCGQRVRRIDATTGIITQVPVTSGDGLILGASAEAGGQLAYLVYRDDEDPSGGTGSRVSDIRRIDPAGQDTLVVSIPTPDHVPTGFVRVGAEHYVTFTPDADGVPSRVDIDHGVATMTPIQFDPSQVPVPTAAGADGTIYGFTWSDSYDTEGNQVFRMGADGIVEGIAGIGVADGRTQRQMGQGSNLRLSAVAVAATRRGNLLIASGHVVYNLVNPADAPTVEPLQFGTPLNYFGGSWDAIDAP